MQMAFTLLWTTSWFRTPISNEKGWIQKCQRNAPVVPKQSLITFATRELFFWTSTQPAEEKMEVEENTSDRCRWIKVNWKWGQIGRVQLGIFLRFNPVVTFLSAAIIWSMVIWCTVQAKFAKEEMSRWTLWITEVFTWMYIGTSDIWAVFIVVLYFSKYGNMKLGKPDDKPEFGDLTYFTMLFAAGVAIGLFYFGVGEMKW